MNTRTIGFFEDDDRNSVICPECDGSCYQAYRDYDTGEWCDEDYCPVCFGAGELYDLPTEEDVSLDRLIHRLMPGPYGPTRVYRDEWAGYDTWLDSLPVER